MTKFTHNLRSVKLRCPHCSASFVAAELQDHVAGMHPSQKQLSNSKIKRLMFRQMDKARKKKQRLRAKKRLESMPPILCQTCGAQVLRGQFKQHLIDAHEASPIILSKSKTKGGKAQYAVTNISRPWQGGAPGLGKRS